MDKSTSVLSSRQLTRMNRTCDSMH